MEWQYFFFRRKGKQVMMHILHYGEYGPGPQQQMGQQQTYSKQSSATETGRPISQITRIISTFVAGLLMAVFLIFSTFDTSYETMGSNHPLLAFAWQVINSGLLLLVGAALVGGIPLLVAAWRTKASRIYFIQALLLICLIPMFIFMMVLWGNTPFYSFTLFVVLGYPFYFGLPILITMRVNRGIRAAQIPERWLHFTQICARVVVFALVLLFLGALAWGLFTALLSPDNFFSLANPLVNITIFTWLLTIASMFIIVSIAARALSRKN